MGIIFKAHDLVFLSSELYQGKSGKISRLDSDHFSLVHVFSKNKSALYYNKYLTKVAIGQFVKVINGPFEGRYGDITRISGNQITIKNGDKHYVIKIHNLKYIPTENSSTSTTVNVNLISKLKELWV